MTARQARIVSSWLTRHGPTVPEQSRSCGGHLAQPHASDDQAHKSAVIQGPRSSQGVNSAHQGPCPDQ